MTLINYINAFVMKHGRKGDWSVTTSPMKADGTYIKTYIFEDGAQMTEVNRPVYEEVEVEVEVKGIKIPVKTSVKLLETECWNTDDATSVKFYERW